MPTRNDGIICRECGGVGCQNCSYFGYSYMRVVDENQRIILEVVPMPYGKILPDLTDCEYPNKGLDENSYLEIIRCPSCGSDNVVILDKKHNPDIAEEQEILAERFFCISCQDSWCYEREH